jgi:hypothetical protein
MRQKLTYKTVSRRSSYYELAVLSIVSSLVNFYEIDSIRDFVRIFNEDLDKIPRVSTGFASTYYRLFYVLDGPDETPDPLLVESREISLQDPAKVANCLSLEIWHLNALGDRDRLIVEISAAPIIEPVKTPLK